MKPMALKFIACYYSRRKPGMDAVVIFGPLESAISLTISLTTQRCIIYYPFFYSYELCHHFNHQNFVHEYSRTSCSTRTKFPAIEAIM